MKMKAYLSCSVLLGVSMSASAYVTKQGEIFDTDNKKVIINGVSWSGFQDTNVLQGLQSNPFYAAPNAQNPRPYGMMDLLSHPWDFPGSGVTKATAVQFKTVRLPIQPEVLYDETNKVDLNRSISNKNFPLEGNGVFCKIWESNGQACQTLVSPKEAFWITLKEMQKHNIRVMIDFHHKQGYGDGMRDGTVYDMDQYAKDLNLLATQIKAQGLDNVIGIDIFNEPYRLNWFQAKGNQVPWTKVIATAANAVHTANPDLLLFVEGPNGGSDDADNPTICVDRNQIVDDPNGYSHSPDPQLCGASRDRVFFKGNWGEDFKPLLNQQSAKVGQAVFDKERLKTELTKQGIKADALTWLLGDADANNSHIVFSPHVYPAEVAGWETAPGEPSKLRFDWTWGFLHQAGYSVVLGEASWKQAAGKAFFTDSMMNYLKNSGIGTNNVYFWAIGFLGDTVSAIDPNSGELNLDVQTTLRPYFGEVAPTGTANVTFVSNTPLTGSVPLTVSSGNSVKNQYTCSLTDGCTLQLAPDQYKLSVPATYKLQIADKTLYQVKTDSDVSVTVEKDQAVQNQIPLQVTPSAYLQAHHVNVALQLKDEQGQTVTESLTGQIDAQFTAQDKAENSSQCTINGTECTADLYNDNVNEQGEFGNQVFTVKMPAVVTDTNGKTYQLDQGSETQVTIKGNQEETLTLPVSYVQKATNNVGACEVSVNIDNWWGTGAVFQGSIRNNGDEAIKHFNLVIDLGNAGQSIQVVNAWMGNNTKSNANGNHLSFSTDTYDSYNGLLKGQTQNIGFQIQGNFTGAPTIVSATCQQ